MPRRGLLSARGEGGIPGTLTRDGNTARIAQFNRARIGVVSQSTVTTRCGPSRLTALENRIMGRCSVTLLFREVHLMQERTVARITSDVP
jgi:hypothetical protein